MITIIDYGLGNLESIKNMIKKVGGKAVISSNVDEIENASSLILPGVGHFGKAMEIIRSRSLDVLLNKKVVEEKTPILGICLGMQLLLEHSEEGDCRGLGWIEGDVKKFTFNDDKLKVPHMGWTNV
jgi:glutamine amidotransferase